MGKLIVFEGIDGAGKATQVELLKQLLLTKKEEVSVFSSPRYDLPTGAIVKDALYGAYGDFVGLSPYLSALPYLVDFAAWQKEMREALKKGVVICDRYVPSTVAYHSAKLSGERADEFVRLIEEIAYEHIGIPKPDLVVYLHVPVETARRLMQHKKHDQHERNAAYQARVAATYEKLALRDTWHKVECVQSGAMRSIEDIHAEIARIVRI